MNRELLSRLVNKNGTSLPEKRIYLKARVRPARPAEPPVKKELGLKGENGDEYR